MRREAPEESTRDSRFLRHKLCGGERLWLMYSSNIRVEGDGLAYHELNLLRAILLEPILCLVMAANLILVYGGSYSRSKSRGIAFYLARNSGHFFGLVGNILRYFVSISIVIIEVILWPFRIVFGIMLSPLGLLVSAGHIYSLPFSVFHDIANGAGVTVIRKVKVKLICPQPQSFNAGRLGLVHCYVADSATDAEQIASAFKIKQRCGVGPECILIRGKKVYVSNWSSINLTSMFGMTKTEWKLLDITLLEWRRTIFDISIERSPNDTNRTRCEIGGSCVAEVQAATRLWASLQYVKRRCKEVRKELLQWMLKGNVTRRCNDVQKEKEGWKWAQVRSSEDLGTVSNLADLELYYNSPLGWNKYHRMRADGHRILVIRHDRRLLSHLIAAVSSLLLYVQFRDSSLGWLGLSIELYGLVIANYTLITSYAAKILIGKASDLVDAKSDRYGVIVTRAIDRGFVRGFHVQNGSWLRYKHEDSSLPVHVIERNEVNAVCNSLVYDSDDGPLIKAMAYQTLPLEHYHWNS